VHAYSRTSINEAIKSLV